MSAILILGGGFGGLACARALRAELGATHRVTIVDRAPRFVVGATKTWVMLGERSAAEVTSPRRALVPEGVELIEADILSIDPANREVMTTRGPLTADHLVLALGAELDMGIVPGLAEAAHTFYTLEGASRLREALAGFPGGRLLLLIPRTPFQCPPGPYEAALLVHALLENRGIREKTELEIWTVEKAPMATAGPKMGELIVRELTARKIGFHPLKKTAVVDAGARRVRFEDSSETSYDLLIAIPPHRVPRVVVEAGLAAPEGWIAVDPKTLEVRAASSPSGVYAVGDVTSLPLPGRFDPSAPLVLPKAGVFAAAEGETVAARIAASISGAPATAAFDGRGYCFVEVGGGQAMRAEGSFFETPHPIMAARPADESQYRDKLAWVAGWLGGRGRG